MEEKICTNCKDLKPINEFPPDKKHSDGHASWCRVCGRMASKRWADNHKDSIKQRRIKNKQHIIAYGKKRWIEKKEHMYKKSREWALSHPDKMSDYSKACRARNYEHAKELGRKAAIRRISTVTGKLNNRMGTDIRYSLTKGLKNGQRWEILAGYTVDQLKVHLEKQFKDGMSWENYGITWEIDHKIPKSIFNFTKPEDIDFKRCWALKNLRPLEKHSNRVKSAKIDRPFQPSLAIAV